MQNKINGLGNWLGQHIWQFISRFRNKVYLEDVDPGTTTDVLVREADGEVTVVSGSVIGGVNSVTAAASALSVGPPLVITPNTGAVIVTPQSYSGGTKLGHVPTGGSASTWLRGDGAWTAPPGTGVDSVTTTDGTFIDLTPNTATTGAVTVTADLSASNPPSALNYLRGDNQWASIAVTINGTLGTSTGAPLTISPNTGNIIVTPNAYDGTTNEGFVPRGGVAGTFLEGDGGWGTPTGSGVTSVTGTLPIVSSGGTTPAISINTATSTTLGVVELGSDTDLTSTYAAGVVGIDNRVYPVQLNAADQMGVNVPWTDSGDTTYTAGVGLTLTGFTVFDANVDGVQSVVPTASSAIALRTYKVQVDASDNLVVNVPWAGSTYSAMTTSVLGLGKLRYATGATPAANAQTTTAERTYGVTENASNQLVVNVPWRGGTGVDDFTNANGTFISAGTVNTAATGSVTMGTIDLSATGLSGTPAIAATQFLRGDNTWDVPAGAGVTSILVALPTSSTGNSISIAPSSGAVTVSPHAYVGGANVGFVPDGGTNKKFLRGDGTWQTGTFINTATFHQHLRAYGKSADMASGQEYVLTQPSGNNEHKFTVDVGTSDITAMDPKDAVQGSIMVVQDDDSTLYRWNGWVYGTNGAAVTLRLYMVAPVCEGDDEALSVCKLATDVTINMLGNNDPICFQATPSINECIEGMDNGTLIVLTAELEGDGSMNFVVSTSLTLQN